MPAIVAGVRHSATPLASARGAAPRHDEFDRNGVQRERGPGGIEGFQRVGVPAREESGRDARRIRARRRNGPTAGGRAAYGDPEATLVRGDIAPPEDSL